MLELSAKMKLDSVAALFTNEPETALDKADTEMAELRKILCKQAEQTEYINIMGVQLYDVERVFLLVVPPENDKTTPRLCLRLEREGDPLATYEWPVLKNGYIKVSMRDDTLHIETGNEW